MRELEFLPAWYPQLRRRRRQIVMQAWASALLVAGLGLWLLWVGHHRRLENHRLGELQEELTQAGSQVEEMTRLTSLQRQWSKQDEVLARLGAHVESMRVISTLASLMPADMSLLSLNMKVEEMVPPGVVRTAMSGQANQPLVKQLRVEVEGVAPTDVDLATFVTELNRVRFFDKVAMEFAKDLRRQGRIMRHFKLAFAVGLTANAGS